MADKWAQFVLPEKSAAPPPAADKWAKFTVNPNPQQPDEKSLAGFGGNVLTSGGNFVSDLAHAVTHPIDTLTGMGKVITGGMQKGLEAVGFPKPQEEQATGKSTTPETDALVKHVTDRYGSLGKAGETMYSDPVGFLGDLSTLFGGVGEVAEVAKLGKVAKVAATVSKVTDPVRGTAAVVGAIPGVKAGVTAAADATKAALNKGALRAGFQTTTDAGKVTGAVDAMTEHSIPFSEAGQKQVDALLRDLQQQKEAATGRRGSVDPRLVEDRLDQVATKKEWQVNPNADQKQVEAVRHGFRERTGGQPILDVNGKPVKDRYGNKMFSQGQPIPADEAQALKEGTYANNDYESTPAHRRATADTEMALARGLKEELETQIPELAGLNANQAKLLNLKGILETAVNKYTNDGTFWGTLAKNTISSPKGALKSAGVIGSGAAMHNPLAGAGVTLMQAILSDPAVKARLARAIGVAQMGNPGKYAGAVTPAARISSYAQSLNPQQQ